MEIVVVLDGAIKTILSEDLITRIQGLAEAHGHAIELLELSSGDIAPCTGCLRCLSSGSGVCVARDSFAALRGRVLGRDLAVFLSPALFGQCSSTIKNALDKGISQKIGSSANVATQFIVGYGAEVDDEEKATFIDCVRLHLGRADVIHYEFRDLRIEAFVTRSLGDNASIAEKVGELLRERGAA
jgi:multimeric flavodoxin WrbA